VTPAETARLLVLVTGYDQRQFDEVSARAWSTTLFEHTFDDAVAAVHRHYRHSSKWAMPADIRLLAGSIVADRINSQRAREPKALEPADMSGAARARQIIEQLAEQRRIPVAESPHPKQDVELQRRARRVRCPWCKANPGEQCVNQGTRRPAVFVHEARLTEAAQPTEVAP
jgi:hypothetical protein